MQTLNLVLPTCWQELTPKQLRYVYYLISTEKFSSAEIKTYVLFRWSGMEDITPEGDGYFVKMAGQPYHLTALQIAEVLPYLSWVDELPKYPVRLQEVAGHSTKISADLSGLTFEQFLMLDNLYQGYLHTLDKELLGSMACTLYGADQLDLQPEEYISIFYWFASAKALLARRFKHFYQPSSVDESTSGLDVKLQEATDTQIRALTKGDITKEKDVLAMDMYRALTELDAQAADAEDLKRQTQSL